MQITAQPYLAPLMASHWRQGGRELGGGDSGEMGVDRGGRGRVGTASEKRGKPLHLHLRQFP